VPARLPRTTLFLALVALLLTTAPTGAAAATRLRGIDVSQYQGTIDWATVATTPTRFAIVRATRGVSYDDPTFASNVAGATSNGIVVGAYHRATPRAQKDGHADLTDARLEADHFLSVARPGLGDLIPALDIEETGGMPPTELVAWVRKWVTHVTNVLGVHPMIYTSPYFWTVDMGDTTWFADHGYRLWLAHWNVQTPTVPANDWEGAGWTFWQWTHRPGLPGVSGDLDRDRFDGTDLRTAEISRLTVQTGAGGSVADAAGRLACGDGSSCDALFDPSAMVTLTATPDPGAVFLSWSGACASAGSSPSCLVTVLGAKRVTATFGYPLTVSTAGPGSGSVTSSRDGVACPSRCEDAFPAGTAVSLTAAPDAASEFDRWSGDCSGFDPSSCTVVLDRPRTVTASFADLGPPSVAITTPTTLNGAVRFTFSEPVHRIDPGNLTLKVAGGSKVAATLACRDDGGHRVSCRAGPVLSASLRTSRPLIAGQSYVAVANPTKATTKIVDRAANELPRTTAGFRAATDLAESAPGSAFRWGTRSDPRAAGGSYLYERRPGAAAMFTFSGPSVTLSTIAGPAFGSTRVEIDGVFRTRLDRHRPSFAIVPRTFGGLGRGPHTITAIALPPAPGTPTGTGIDAIADASGTRRSPRTIEAAWGPVDASGAVGGSYVASGVASARAAIRFRGTAMALRTVTGPSFGIAELWVDGSLVRRVDLSAPTVAYDVLRRVRGLTDRVHTIRVVVVGAAGKSGSGTNVAIDGWIVT
jgi:GH25 family lysozyme M1 (1,4-beta-N-acetylmuramidase)